MPSSIPYDPSLVLGNLVSQEKLANLEKISSAQAEADAAEDTLNSLIASKRSIDMTAQELINMGIDSQDLIKESKELGKNIQKAAVEYAKAKLAAEKKIQPLKAKIRGLASGPESPIDYNKSQIKKMPLSADSLRMNCQYFSFDENSQTSGTHAATVGAFVSEEVSYLGEGFASQAKTAAQEQTNSQHSRHSINGTLVISISCTHKEAVLLAPFILDVDKAIRVWNMVNTGSKIDTADRTKLAAGATRDNPKDNLTLLSGATYGSSFIGMVHILNTTDTKATETIYSLAESMQAQFNVGGWFASASGGFGVDSSFSNDAKNLLSSQNVTSHATLFTMGTIPSLKSNEVQIGVKAFTDDDGAKSMAKLQQLQNANADSMTSIDSAAASARTGQQMVSMQNAKVTGVLSGLSDIDEKANKIIDINSLMDAMQDYVDKCLAGNIGVPINYYTKPILRSELIRMWLAKYYPNKYNKAGSGDDSTNQDSGASTSPGE